MSRSLTAAWRDAVRDSDLDRTAKLVAYTIGTYMNAAGVAYPSKALIASGATLGAGRRAVDTAIDRIEAAGLLEVRRTNGRTSFTYVARGCDVDDRERRTEVRRSSESNVAPFDAQRRTNRRSTSHPGATESAESAESVSRHGERAPSARADLSYLDDGAVSG